MTSPRSASEPQCLPPSPKRETKRSHTIPLSGFQTYNFDSDTAFPCIYPPSFAEQTQFSLPATPGHFLMEKSGLSSPRSPGSLHSRQSYEHHLTPPFLATPDNEPPPFKPGSEDSVSLRQSKNRKRRKERASNRRSTGSGRASGDSERSSAYDRNGLVSPPSSAMTWAWSAHGIRQRETSEDSQWVAKQPIQAPSAELFRRLSEVSANQSRIRRSDHSENSDQFTKALLNKDQRRWSLMCQPVAPSLTPVSAFATGDDFGNLPKPAIFDPDPNKHRRSSALREHGKHLQARLTNDTPAKITLRKVSLTYGCTEPAQPAHSNVDTLEGSRSALASGPSTGRQSYVFVSNAVRLNREPSVSPSALPARNNVAPSEKTLFQGIATPADLVTTFTDVHAMPQLVSSDGLHHVAIEAEKKTRVVRIMSKVSCHEVIWEKDHSPCSSAISSRESDKSPPKSQESPNNIDRTSFFESSEGGVINQRLDSASSPEHESGLTRVPESQDPLQPAPAFYEVGWALSQPKSNANGLDQVDEAVETDRTKEQNETFTQDPKSISAGSKTLRTSIGGQALVKDQAGVESCPSLLTRRSAEWKGSPPADLDTLDAGTLLDEDLVASGRESSNEGKRTLDRQRQTSIGNRKVGNAIGSSSHKRKISSTSKDLRRPSSISMLDLATTSQS